MLVTIPLVRLRLVLRLRGRAILPMATFMRILVGQLKKLYRVGPVDKTWLLGAIRVTLTVELATVCVRMLFLPTEGLARTVILTAPPRRLAEAADPTRLDRCRWMRL